LNQEQESDMNAMLAYKEMNLVSNNGETQNIKPVRKIPNLASPPFTITDSPNVYNNQNNQQQFFTKSHCFYNNQAFP